MKKKITLNQFMDELVNRLHQGKTVDCCKAELENLALVVKDKIGQEMIEVTWKD